MSQLNLLLGCGFSYNAGLPLAKSLSEKLEINYINKIIRWSSSEWRWVDGKPKEEIHYRRLNLDHLAYAYLMNEVVSEYVSSNGRLINYEIFYTYVEQQGTSRFPIIVERAKAKYIQDFLNKNTDVLKKMENLDYSDLTGLINYLIADSLELNKSIESIFPEYINFLQYLNNFGVIKVHTLNHDLLFEKLLEVSGCDYSDGFSTDHSELVHLSNKVPVRTFNNHFPNNILSLIKLHGSIDLNKYEVAQDHGFIHELEGRGIYFKPKTYTEKHNAIRIDPQTGKILQNLHFNVTPRFITGINKTFKIQGDYMYSKLFNEFEKNIVVEDSILIIIGYSYCDKHINDIIQKAKLTTKIITIDPTNQFPFTQYKNIKHFRYISDAFSSPTTRI
jgi:hypothetical protein